MQPSFQLSIMAILMVADATMMKKTTYAGTSCEGNPTEDEWQPVGVCFDVRSRGQGYLQMMCNGNDVVATGYTNSQCTTVNQSLSIPGLNLVAGVFSPGSSCVYTTGDSDSEKWSCANQPIQARMIIYSDSTCSTTGTHDGYSEIKMAYNVCDFDTEKSKMRTLNGTMSTEKVYTSLDCTGTSTDSVSNLSSCAQISLAPPAYYQIQSSGITTAAQAQTAANQASGTTGTTGTTATTNTTNSTIAPVVASSSEASLPYSIIASVLLVVASAAASI